MKKVINIMKIRTSIKILLAISVFAVMMAACSKKGDYDHSLFYPNVLVTVKTADNGNCYLQLDDKVTLKPINLLSPPYKKEVRALANVSKVNQEGKPYNHAVHVHWMDSIRTKKTVPTAGDENDKKFGTAPLDIINNWVTVLEDGYLTISFYGMWGERGKVHYINLLTGVNPADPFEVELRHDSNGDLANGYGRRAMGIIAFKLPESLKPSGENKKLKVKYRSFSGEKTVTFEFANTKAASGELSGKSGVVPNSLGVVR